MCHGRPTSELVRAKNVVEALGLAAADQTGTSDPFVKVRSRTTHNPGHLKTLTAEFSMPETGPWETCFDQECLQWSQGLSPEHRAQNVAFTVFYVPVTEGIWP